MRIYRGYKITRTASGFVVEAPEGFPTVPSAYRTGAAASNAIRSVLEARRLKVHGKRS